MIFHYAPLDAFRGIVESRSIWCSDLRYLNDYQEVEHGKTWLMHTLGALVKSEPKLKRSGIVYQAVSGLVTTEMTAFACSFCEAPDRLSQWRGYAGSAGVAIGIDETALHAATGLVVDRVIYTQDELIASFNDIIERAINRPLRDAKTVDSLRRSLTRQIFSSKSEAFIEEGESRLILTVEAANTHPSVRDHKIKYRTRGALMIPYVEIDLAPIFSEIIKEVWVGPSNTGDLLWKSAKEFLAYNNLREVEVRRSAAPYRT